MTQKEYTLFTDGEAWVDYHSNLYECIGKENDKWILSDVNDGYVIYASEKTLRYSTEFFYTEKF